ncbi:MAG: type IX secretion system protein PorQ [Paludibacter sp.]|nr:type IX secretion system protein PorQ [Paludibacter sp.]MDD4198364.1 type IX secretion system protein PorQ [Paludibacter sp.]MDD4428339.1 type IX secretion system protein PorQ [Paludibacter sp.]
MKVKISVIFVLFFFVDVVPSFAGTGVFQFLDLPVSSRMAALGGKNVSVSDHDINFSLLNPALLTNKSDNMIGLNMANYLADIKFGTAIYGRSYGKNHFAVGVQYVDYGSFKKTTEYNEIQGEFSAKDISMSLIYSRMIAEGLFAGATLKPVYSAYEDYVSYGAAIDLGLSYQHPEKLFYAGLVFRNMGTQFKGYYSGADGQHREPLPFDIQLGLSHKLEHAPFRVSLTFHNLHDWKMKYIDNKNSMLDYERENLIPAIPFIDNVFRHAVFGVEFLPGKNFYLAASYNHRRHQELKMDGFKSMAGFSFGGGIKISYFQIGFGMSQFQVGNTAYLFSISTSLNEFRL